MKPKIYIETSIPSFYYETRTEPSMIEDEIYEIVEEYINKLLMPKNPTGDALHLALASYHHCHFLLTWNCNHLANANKFEHIRHINNTLGLFVPNLITPLELMKLA